MSGTSLIFDLAGQIRAIHAAIDKKTRTFQTKTGLNCLPGCGKCCLSPTVEAHVAEMLPLALKLVASGAAFALHDKLEQCREPVCILYRPNALDPTKGHCSAYEMRPSVCRLFGFAAVSGKPEQTGQLSTCRIIKEKDPQAVKKAADLIETDDDIPYARDFGLQIEVLAPGTAYAELLPINAAIKVALEKLSLLPESMTDIPPFHETQHKKSPSNIAPSA